MIVTSLPAAGPRRGLYTWAALGAALIVFAGFARTFYLKGLYSPTALSNLLLVHGALMTLWFGLFIVQVRLVATGRTGLHRRLGAFGAVVFVLILAFGVATSLDGARRGATPTPEVPPLVFLAVPLFDLLGT